jgi:hypothetical protein
MNYDHEELCEAWAETRATALKRIGQLTPSPVISILEYKEFAWFDEMDRLYGEEDNDE